jgi:taurine dioxygenase
MNCKIFDNYDLNSLSDDDFWRIRKAVPKHGVICLRNQNLSADDLVALTKRFGEPVLLPEGLRFNNTEAEYPELARVSNILPDGSLITDHNAAEYWHSDGDFWQPGSNFLFNLLYSVKVPEQGGATGFADLRLAYTSLSDTVKRRIKHLKVIVSCDEIPDFKNTPAEQREPDAIHSITHQHVETGRTGLYFGHTLATIKNLPKPESDEIVRSLVDAIERPENQYVHDWQKGDLLIWDNTSVMHRSMGGYGNHPRLLYRSQAFIRPLVENNPKHARTRAGEVGEPETSLV